MMKNKLTKVLTPRDFECYSRLPDPKWFGIRKIRLQVLGSREQVPLITYQLIIGNAVHFQVSIDDDNIIYTLDSTELPSKLKTGFSAFNVVQATCIGMPNPNWDEIIIPEFNEIVGVPILQGQRFGHCIKADNQSWGKVKVTLIGNMFEG